jgi:DNA-binding protein YbaB
MSFVPDDLLRSFELRAEEQAAQARRLSARIEQSTATAESPDGEVTVTVDSTGGLAGLRFDAAAERLPLDRLAALVLDTSRRAQAKIAKQVGDLVSETYGLGSPTADFVSGAYAERFGGEPDGEVAR